MNERSLAVDISYVGLGTPGDGVPATAYKRFPVIHENSMVFNFNEASMKAFKAMGASDPWAVLYRKGDPDSVEFAIPSPTAEEMQFFCGGTIDADGRWNEPISIPSIVKSLKLNTLPYEGKYTEYVITKGSVSARLSQAPSEEDTDLLLVKVTKQSVFDSAGNQCSAFSRQVKAVAKTKVTGISISGEAKVDARLTAEVTPVGATGTYQWFRKKDSEEAVEIPNADMAGYIIAAEDVGCTISVKFTGTDYYTGTATSTETAVVTA